MVLAKLQQLIGLETENANKAQAAIDELTKENEALKEAVTSLTASKAELSEANALAVDKIEAATAVIETRIEQINGLNLTPVVDGLAVAVMDSEEVETPEAIANDTAIDTENVTSTEATEAIVEILAESPELIVEEAVTEAEAE